MKVADSLKYAHKGLLIILSVFVVAATASIVFLSYTLLKLDSLIETSGQTIGTSLRLQQIFIYHDDAESSARGYVISGDQKYLETYNRSVKGVAADLNRLEAVNDSRISQQHMKKLRSLSAARLAALQRLVDARTTGGEDAAREVLATGEGPRLMEQLRREVSAISMGTMQDIRPRQEQSHDNLRHALVVAGVLSAFVLGLCATVLWYFRRSILRERALEGTKSEFLSLASHQLRTPATNVKQYVGLLLDGYLGDLSDKQVDALKIAYKNNESEIRIMNDLLDVAKLDLKRIQLRKQRVNIVSIVSQVAKTYEPITTARGQTLTIKSPPELMAVVDRAYFKGVLEKLIDNAVKYSQNNTRISVKVRVDEVHDMFVIKVRDHGLGIKKRELPKLFMKFSRLDNEFSANTEGSGLGLYWVKQILALHGGSVDVVTEEGKGSKFIVRAPIGG